jgi:hypothetical protein
MSRLLYPWWLRHTSAHFCNTDQASTIAEHAHVLPRGTADIYTRRTSQYSSQTLCGKENIEEWTGVKGHCVLGSVKKAREARCTLLQYKCFASCKFEDYLPLFFWCSLTAYRNISHFSHPVSAGLFFHKCVLTFMRAKEYYKPSTELMVPLLAVCGSPDSRSWF